MSAIKVTLPPMPTPPPEVSITLELSLLEAQELRAILLATYNIESDIEMRLSSALQESGLSTMGPFSTKKDAGGDLMVYRRRGQ